MYRVCLPRVRYVTTSFTYLLLQRSIFSAVRTIADDFLVNLKNNEMRLNWPRYTRTWPHANVDQRS